MLYFGLRPVVLAAKVNRPCSVFDVGRSSGIDDSALSRRLRQHRIDHGLVLGEADFALTADVG